MPQTKVIFYREASGAVPLISWMADLHPKAQEKGAIKIERLRQLGHELRRPEADYLRDGIYELRVGLEGKNYRILYFYRGAEAIVVSHGIVKESIIPRREIARALTRKKNFESNPFLHTHREITQ